MLKLFAQSPLHITLPGKVGHLLSVIWFLLDTYYSHCKRVMFATRLYLLTAPKHFYFLFELCTICLGTRKFVRQKCSADDCVMRLSRYFHIRVSNKYILSIVSNFYLVVKYLLRQLLLSAELHLWRAKWNWFYKSHLCENSNLGQIFFFRRKKK